MSLNKLDLGGKKAIVIIVLLLAALVCATFFFGGDVEKQTPVNKPVSYTHLDVYKRQRDLSCPASLTSPPSRWRPSKR